MLGRGFGELGDRVDHPVRIARGRADDQGGALVEGGPGGSHVGPLRMRIDRDPHDLDVEQVPGLEERRMHRGGHHHRGVAVRLTREFPPALACGEDREHARLGPPGGERADLTGRPRAEQAEPRGHEVVLDGGEAGEGGGIEAVDVLGQ